MSERQEGFTGALVKNGETSSSAVAAKAKAEVEAAYLVAINRPRSVSQARIDILEACKRPRFAESALYTKPIGGGKTVTDFSIRGVETFIQSWGNINVSQDTVYEDDDIRIVSCKVTDLERNTSWGNTITVKKTVERRSKKDREVVAERTNTYGDTVYIVKATEDELQNKVGAQISKSVRNHGLRIFPRDILDEAREVIEQTLDAGGTDPALNVKRLTDAFAGIGIDPVEIEKFLGHTLKRVQPAEIAELRGIFQALKDGEAKWGDYVDGAKRPEKASLSPDDLKAGETEQDGQKPLTDSDKADIRLDEICDSCLPTEIAEYFDKKAVAKALILDHFKIDSAVDLTEAQFKALPKYLKGAEFLDLCRAEQILR